MLILYVCLFALAFANPLDPKDKNAMLKKSNKVLLQTLKQLTSENDAEKQVADDGGCYNRCRSTGAGFNECHKNCPLPEEIEVGQDSDCYNRCRQAGGGFTECSSDCGYAEKEEEEEVGNDACRDTNKVGHGRSMSEGQMCDTRWDHVSWWRARHEYCKNDKGYWGCQYGYKRSGWNDYCCNAWERRNTNRCRCN